MVTDAKDFLGKEVEVIIDRPLGSKHPKYGFIYETNYGFIPNTASPDGKELDVNLLSTPEVAYLLSSCSKTSSSLSGSTELTVEVLRAEGLSAVEGLTVYKKCRTFTILPYN